MEFLKANLWEIKKSSTVRIFGILLSLGHVLTFVHWFLQDKLPIKYASSSTPMCWPIMETCDVFRSVPLSLLKVGFGGYLLFAIIAAVLLISSRLVGIGWFFFLLATLLKATLYLQDYRLSANIHYLHFLLSIVWLFIPCKTLSFKLLIVSYFLTSATQKLSPEWLTGRWFLQYMEMPVKLAEWFAALSTIIEFIAPIALFFKDGRYFITSFLTLISYLFMLIYIDNFFAPTLLLLFIFVFPLAILEERRIEREFIYQSFIRPEPSTLWAYFLGSLFVIGQVLPLVPNLPVPLHNAGIVLALTPGAKVNECRQNTFLIYNHETKEVGDEFKSHLAEDARCNPYLRFLEVRSLCDEKKTDNNFVTVASFFYSRGLKDTSFKEIFGANDICTQSLKYRDLGVGHGI
ncbi:MAG: hypothetical protein KDD34_04510 [Bdellovibrionales bacterium]|nr:hypothetical protein [Bdellovibrionales bacterium]